MDFTAYTPKILPAHLQMKSPSGTTLYHLHAACLCLKWSSPAYDQEMQARFQKGAAVYVHQLVAAHLNPILDVVEAHLGDVITLSAETLLVAWFCESERYLENVVQMALACYTAWRKEGLLCLILATTGQTIEADYHVGIGCGPCTSVLLGVKGSRQHALVGEAVSQAVTLCAEARNERVLIGDVAASKVDPWCIYDPINPLSSLPAKAVVEIKPGLDAAKLLRTFSDSFYSRDPESPTPYHNILEEPVENDIPDVSPTKVKLHSYVSDVVLRSPGDCAAQIRPVSVVCIRLGDTAADLSQEGYAALERSFNIVATSLAKFDGLCQRVAATESGLVALCVFGLPLHSHTNDAQRSLEFARHVIEKINDNAETAFIGITRARMYCGTLGKERLAFGCFGPSLGIATQLMNMAASKEYTQYSTIMMEPGTVLELDADKLEFQTESALVPSLSPKPISVYKIEIFPSTRPLSFYSSSSQGSTEEGALPYEVRKHTSPRRFTPARSLDCGWEPENRQAVDLTSVNEDTDQTGTGTSTPDYDPYENLSCLRSESVIEASQAGATGWGSVNGAQSEALGNRFDLQPSLLFDRTRELAAISRLQASLGKEGPRPYWAGSYSSGDANVLRNSSQKSQRSFRSVAQTIHNDANLQHPRLMVIYGEMGMGTSSLLNVAAKMASETSMEYVHVCSHKTEQVPLSAAKAFVVGIMTRYHSIADHGWVDTLESPLKDLLPWLKIFCPIHILPEIPSSDNEFDVESDSQHLFNFLLHIVKYRYKKRPLLILLDNGQSTDADSYQFFKHLLVSVNTVGVIIGKRYSTRARNPKARHYDHGSVLDNVDLGSPLGATKKNFREVIQQQLAYNRYAQEFAQALVEDTAADLLQDYMVSKSAGLRELHLEALGLSSFTQLMEGVLDTPVHPAMACMLHQKCDGNPGLGILLINSLRSRNLICMDAMEATLDPSVVVADIALPGIDLSTRVQSLPPRHILYLQVASVIGFPFSIGFMLTCMEAYTPKTDPTRPSSSCPSKSTHTTREPVSIEVTKETSTCHSELSSVDSNLRMPFSHPNSPLNPNASGPTFEDKTRRQKLKEATKIIEELVNHGCLQIHKESYYGCLQIHKESYYDGNARNSPDNYSSKRIAIHNALYYFRSDVMAQNVFQSLRPADRAEIHGKIARILEDESKLEVSAGDVARHLLGTTVLHFARTVQYVTIAAMEYLATKPEDCVAILDRALDRFERDGFTMHPEELLKWQHILAIAYHNTGKDTDFMECVNNCLLMLGRPFPVSKVGRMFCNVKQKVARKSGLKALAVPSGLYDHAMYARLLGMMCDYFYSYSDKESLVTACLTLMNVAELHVRYFMPLAYAWMANVSLFAHTAKKAEKYSIMMMDAIEDVHLDVIEMANVSTSFFQLAAQYYLVCRDVQNLNKCFTMALGMTPPESSRCKVDLCVTRALHNALLGKFHKARELIDGAWKMARELRQLELELEMLALYVMIQLVWIGDIQPAVGPCQTMSTRFGRLQEKNSRVAQRYRLLIPSIEIHFAYREDPSAESLKEIPDVLLELLEDEVAMSADVPTIYHVHSLDMMFEVLTYCHEVTEEEKWKKIADRLEIKLGKVASRCPVAVPIYLMWKGQSLILQGAKGGLNFLLEAEKQAKAASMPYYRYQSMFYHAVADEALPCDQKLDLLGKARDAFHDMKALRMKKVLHTHITQLVTQSDAI